MSYADGARFRARLDRVIVELICSMMAVSLPVPTSDQLPALDESRNVWLFTAPNPNLRIVGDFGGQVQPGLVGLGLVVAISPSFMQGARFPGRLFLRDGYHRAIGFLRLYSLGELPPL